MSHTEAVGLTHRWHYHTHAHTCTQAVIKDVIISTCDETPVISDVPPESLTARFIYCLQLSEVSLVCWYIFQKTETGETIIFLVIIAALWISLAGVFMSLEVASVGRLEINERANEKAERVRGWRRDACDLQGPALKSGKQNLFVIS